MPYYDAVEAIIERVKDTAKPGYIWHTTDSGKTLPSFFPTPTPSSTPIALTPGQTFL
jgi:type I site-specific restriction-modification system R (restriction) subunit